MTITGQSHTPLTALSTLHCGHNAVVESLFVTAQPTTRPVVFRQHFPAQGTYRLAPPGTDVQPAGRQYHPRHLTPRAALLSTAGCCLLIVVVALTLRPAVTSVGSVLAQVVAGTGLSPTQTNVIVAIPLACFSIGGFLASPLRTWFGANATVAGGLGILATALVWRVAVGPTLMLAGTVVAFLAIAVLAALIPGIIRSAPASRFTVLTTCFTTAMGTGSGIGALITPYLSTAVSWYFALASWGLLATAAFLAWLVAGRRIAPPVPTAGPATHANPFRLTPASTAWGLTVHLGMVTAFTFTCMGWLPEILLAASVPTTTTHNLFALAMALGVFFAPFVPKLAERQRRQPALAVLLAAPAVLAVTGLLLDPARFALPCAVLLGVAMVAAILPVALIGLRAADPASGFALSSLVHGAGFAIAALVSFAVGQIHTLTGSWQWPLCALLGIVVVQLLTGIVAGLPRQVHAR